MLVRTAFAVVCSGALVAAGLSPAPAGASHYHDDLRVKVCKYVDSEEEYEEFDIDVWTDEDEDDTTLGHRECERFELVYDDNKFWLDEEVNPRYWDTYFRVAGDVEKARAWRGGRLKIWFDDDVKRPRLWIKIYNVED